jgi:hypothetical protein
MVKGRLSLRLKLRKEGQIKSIEESKVSLVEKRNRKKIEFDKSESTKTKKKQKLMVFFFFFTLPSFF